MARQPVTFAGSHGALEGVIEGADLPVRGFAVFAHCFTCGKDSLAATKISRALATRGVSVLRFDFTGLGGSEGDLANAGFAGNVDDLVAAAQFLEAEHEAPALLIGHSLGGTAVLAAAERIPSCRAVVTIGAPAEPAHAMQFFAASAEAIGAAGAAEVELAGRRVRISRQFLDELETTSIAERVHRLRRALLIMHAPLDTVVGIDEAGSLFAAAMHPKSFVSLDRADHLLTDPADADYVAATISGWAERYLPSPAATAHAATTGVEKGTIRVLETNRRFGRRVITDTRTFVADEPVAAGGDDAGPDPYELLLAALGACTSMTIRMYANHKQWDLTGVDVTLDHRRAHAQDCADCAEADTRLEVIRRRIRIEGNLSSAQRARLLEIADRCPVHRTLTGRLEIESELVGEPGAG